MEIKQKLYNRLLDEGVRTDSVYSNVTGKGIQGRDKLKDVRPSSLQWSEIDLLEWYAGLIFISRPIDRRANDIYREGFEILTGDEGLDKAIRKRLDELEFETHAIQHEKNKDIFRRGSVMFMATTSNDVVTQIDLSTKLANVNRIESLNIIPAYEVTVMKGNDDPTTANYNIPSLIIRGKEIHRSRFNWHVNNYINKLGYGISLVEQLIEVGSAMDIALWSLATMVYEAQIKVVKSNAKTDGTKFNIQTFINKLKSYINSQSVVLLGETESFDKQNLTITGLKDVTDYFERVHGFISGISYNISSGQGKRVISLANDPENVSYATLIEHSQEQANKYISLVVNTILAEKNINKAGTKFEINWLPLTIVDDNTQADIDLKNSQADTNYFNMQVKNSEDIQKERFPEIAEKENESLIAEATGA